MLLVRASAPPPEEAAAAADPDNLPSITEYVSVLTRFLSGNASFTEREERLLLHVTLVADP